MVQLLFEYTIPVYRFEYMKKRMKFCIILCRAFSVEPGYPPHYIYIQGDNYRGNQSHDNPRNGKIPNGEESGGIEDYILWVEPAWPSVLCGDSTDQFPRHTYSRLCVQHQEILWLQLSIY
ncbi:hypothetical protein DV872_20620 [Oceanispirochaeta sp. M1]|nr:hypothetical protein DV872_20620 [Oceanispirochaeta sp. M1]